MSFEIGKTYGGYEFLDILKMSKTEIAYRVRNTLAQRLEVLTVLSSSIQGDQQQMERFLREMKVHARLVHPNIVTFYNAMELERQAVMTTELVEGATLRERLQSGPMHWTDAIGCLCQALSALACAHDQKIVHRDITPETMLITPDGVLKLSDFGLAKAATSPQLTQVGTVVGSLRYISPEQIKGSASLDARGDLYSLGVVLYEALTGKTPFDSKSQFELMLAHVTQTPTAPSELNPAVPPELDQVVLKALAKDPAERYQSAQEFRQTLESVKAALESPSEPAEGEPAVASSAEIPPVAAPPPAPVPAPVAAAPMFQAISSPGSESRVLLVTGLAAGGLAVVVALIYLFAGK